MQVSGTQSLMPYNMKVDEWDRNHKGSKHKSCWLEIMSKETYQDKKNILSTLSTQNSHKSILSGCQTFATVL